MRTRRISDETASVLRLFLSAPDRHRYGREVIALVGLTSGSLYPMLRRLEDQGLLSSTWETSDEAARHGRRARRVYQFTSVGGAMAEALLSEWERSQKADRVGREAWT